MNILKGYVFRMCPIKKQEQLINKTIGSTRFIYNYFLDDKIKDEWYNGNKELAFIATLDADNEELDKICEGDEYMELFEKEVRRLNKNQKFTEFMSAEEENEKLRKTLASAAKTEGIKIGQKENNLKVAKNLIKQGVNLDIIMNATGLSKKELEALHTN